jgi:hypothetical protein
MPASPTGPRLKTRLLLQELHSGAGAGWRAHEVVAAAAFCARKAEGRPKAGAEAQAAVGMSMVVQGRVAGVRVSCGLQESGVRVRRRDDNKYCVLVLRIMRCKCIIHHSTAHCWPSAPNLEGPAWRGLKKRKKALSPYYYFW